jgi:hypothetical protein
MNKIAILLSVIILTFALTACDSSNRADDSNANNGSSIDDETQVTESTNNTNHDNYVPKKAVPDNLPIYPEAILWSDTISYGEGNNWQWLYSTTGSGNEIVEFFTKELQNLGFEIDEEYTIAFREEFFVTTTDSVINVYWLDSDNLTDDVTADTPNRHYGIIINLDEWKTQ